MKKIIFIFFLFTNTIHAQGFTSTSILYSFPLYKNPFNVFNTLKNSKANAPIQMAGMGINGDIPLDGHPDKYIFFDASFSRVNPAAITLQDTIPCNITGNSASLTYVAFSFWGSRKTFHLGLGTALYLGRLRLSGNDQINQKNGFLSPNLILHPRLRLGRISLSALARYGWDLSKSGWKKIKSSSSTQITLPGFNQSGMAITFTMGYIIAHF